MTKPSKRGLYFDVVDRLAKPLYGSNAKLFFDKAYSSVFVAIHLQKNGVQLTGTLRATRCYNPPIFKAKKKLKLKRGEHKTFQATDNPCLTATLWQDVKLVMFLSTMAKPHITTNSHRRVGRSNVLVSTPHIAKLYTTFMKVRIFLGNYVSNTICQDAITGPGYICSTSCSILLLSTVICSSNQHHYVNEKKSMAKLISATSLHYV